MNKLKYMYNEAIKVSRRDEVFTKAFIYYCSAGFVYGFRTMSVSTIRVFSSHFIIIPQYYQSIICSIIIELLSIQRINSSNRRHEWFCWLDDCRYLNSCAVSKFHLFLSFDFLLFILTIVNCIIIIPKWYWLWLLMNK